MDSYKVSTYCIMDAIACHSVDTLFETRPLPGRRGRERHVRPQTSRPIASLEPVIEAASDDDSGYLASLSSSGGSVSLFGRDGPSRARGPLGQPAWTVETQIVRDHKAI